MKDEIILNIFEIIKTTRPATRESARKIFDLLPKTANKYIFDFSNIEFVSRSFAHEIFNLKKELEVQNKKVEFQNLNEPVKKMFEIVSHQSSINNIPPSISTVKIITIDQL